MKIDSLHFYVTDATNTSNWFINYLGFQIVDRVRDNNSLTIAISNKSILLVISSPINHCGTVARYLASRAEGIIDITFQVSQLQPIVNNAKNRGIKILQFTQKEGQIEYACVSGWDCLRHTIIESNLSRSCYLLPNGKLRTLPINTQANYKIVRDNFSFTTIDHVVLNVARRQLEKAVTYYQSLFDFQIQQTFQIQTKQSGLYSQALIDRTGKVQFNINEPTTTNSQIQEFIDLNGGAGIQHLAFSSQNLIQDVSKMRSLGVPFLAIPTAYYLQLKQRLKQDLIELSNRELQSIIEQEVLIDCQRDRPNSLLMQIFTRPVLKQPTFFLEFIERRQQAIGFGKGNFMALFKAVEQNNMVYQT